ncbi:MAG TPA: FecR domain-containing protein [Blastocatellia bacterium]|nr:FecR domain-containing protein [Blastocatellia bacterium]
MFSRHVAKELSAYCNGELPTERSRRVAEHLLGCERCRAQHDEIKFGVQLAESLPIVAAPESIWKNIEASLDEQSHGGRRSTSTPIFTLRPFQVAAAASVLLAIGLGLALFLLRQPVPPPGPTDRPWEVAALAGTPRVGKDLIKGSAQLGVGEWVETDMSSRAKINVADIGQVEIEPNSRIGLVATHPTEHRLSLERGEMRAKTLAPPRLFFVDTPSAVAVDYGCAYTLKVDGSGASLLHVTGGWVWLESHGKVSRVTAGSACAARPGLGPGTPYFEDASAEFLAALTKFDFEDGGSAALGIILTQARPRDSLTLWHLLARVDEGDRARVYDRLAELVPPPEGVTRNGVLELDETELEDWLVKLNSVWW